ncbi:hypothetical protein BH11MYX1_BH11MYX1_47670 [soil metagenome]
MNRLVVLMLAAMFGVSGGCTGPGVADVTVDNETDQPLFSMVLDGSDGSTTGDVLHGVSLLPGAKLLVPAGCGRYSITVAVAGGDQPPGVGMCTITNAEVCASGTTFVIDSNNCALGE